MEYSILSLFFFEVSVLVAQMVRKTTVEGCRYSTSTQLRHQQIWIIGQKHFKKINKIVLCTYMKHITVVFCILIYVFSSRSCTLRKCY